MTAKAQLIAGIPLLLLATLSATAETAVTPIADLKRLSLQTDDRFTEFSVSGVVTHVAEASANVQHPAFVLRDQTGAMRFFDPTNGFPALGSSVIVKGELKTSPKAESWTRGLMFVTTGRAPLAEPRQATLTKLGDPDMDLQNVCVTATVIDVFADDLGPEYDFVLLKDGETVTPVICCHDSALRELIDAQVRVTGLVLHQIPSYRKNMSPCIWVNGPADIVQVAPPPEDPFAFPELTGDIYVNPQQIAKLGKHSVSGVVLATWQPDHVLLRTHSDHVMQLTLCQGEKLPEIGVPCTAVGYPASDTYRINLTRARVKPTGTASRTDEAAEPTTSEHIFLDNRGLPGIQAGYHGRLISLIGLLRHVPAPDSPHRQLLLDCGRFKIPVDFSACPDAIRNVQPGSTVEATGRCVLETAPWSASEVLPRITRIQIVLRFLDDLRTVTPPPWLTVGKLLVIVSLLLLALLAIFVRSFIIKRIGRIKLLERTKLAVELHDSLSQSLVGIAYQITAAQHDQDRASADRKLTTADQMLQSCRAELRNCLFDLRNDTITEKTFDRAIRRTIETFDDQADIAIRFNVNRAPFGDSTVHAVLAIIRELVTNAINHGHAWTIRIAGAINDGKLKFSVRDDGRGFDPKTAPDAADGHFGLDSIRDRVKRLNGTFVIEPAASRGIKATVTLPIK